MRVTCISKAKSVSVSASIPPETGAAEAGSGVAASGIWPSPGHQAGGGVEADPAGAGQIDLGPGMQIGEVSAGALRPLDRLLVGDELDQVARDEARGEAEMAQKLHQQPGGIAAGAAALGQRLLRRPDAGLHPDDIGDGLLHTAVQGHQHVDGALALGAADLRQVCGEARGRSHRAAEGGELLLQHRVVGEGPALGLGFQEEVEGLIVAMSATRSTTTSKCVTRSGKTMRACQLPWGSCCQFRKWPRGSIFSA